MKQNNQMFAVSLIIFLSFSFLLIFLASSGSENKNVDLPEEIQQAKKGDSLIVTDVTNGKITIGFNNKRNN